jgi:hypothetical protein
LIERKIERERVGERGGKTEGQTARQTDGYSFIPKRERERKERERGAERESNLLSLKQQHVVRFVHRERKRWR